jgi:hypothetical protein
MDATSRVALPWLMGAAILVAVFGPRPAWSQTPGAIPDPSTYQGSRRLQEQYDQQQQQFRNQQQQQFDQQQQQFGGQQQRQLPPSGGGVDARRIWQRHPLVPPDRNALIGRWNTHAAATVGGKDSPLGDIGSMFGADVARMASGMLQSVCDSMFGSGIVEFRPNTLVSIGRGGSEKVLTRVEYRGGGDRIAVLPLDPGAFGVAVFDFKGHDRIIAQEIGCAMARAGNASTAGPAVAGARAPPGVAGGATSAVLALATPLAGGNLLVLKHSVVVALANGGLSASTNGTAMKTWHLACESRTPACQQGLQALMVDAAGATRTDASGRGQTQPLPAGHYYVFGAARVANRPMIWNLPVDLKAGTNSITLDQHNLTPVE